MNIKQKLYFLLFLIIVHLVVIIPVISATILLIGKADISVVIVFGFINAIFLSRIFKGNKVYSLILGFLISSISLCLVYLISYIGLSPFFGAMPYIIISLLIWVLIIFNNYKIKNQKRLFLITSLSTLFCLLLSFTLKNIYPNKLNLANKNLVNAELKTIDKNHVPQAGDTIEVGIFTYPLFGLQQRSEIYKTITDENGISKVKLSKSSNYHLFINTASKKYNSFNIDSTDLKNKRLFEIEIE